MCRGKGPVVEIRSVQCWERPAGRGGLRGRRRCLGITGKTRREDYCGPFPLSAPATGFTRPSAATTQTYCFWISLLHEWRIAANVTGKNISLENSSSSVRDLASRFEKRITLNWQVINQEISAASRYTELTGQINLIDTFSFRFFYQWQQSDTCTSNIVIWFDNTWSSPSYFTSLHSTIEENIKI